jgi:hypothetical protein
MENDDALKAKTRLANAEREMKIENSSKL